MPSRYSPPNIIKHIRVIDDGTKYEADIECYGEAGMQILTAISRDGVDIWPHDVKQWPGCKMKIINEYLRIKYVQKDS